MLMAQKGGGGVRHGQVQTGGIAVSTWGIAASIGVLLLVLRHCCKYFGGIVSIGVCIGADCCEYLGVWL